MSTSSGYPGQGDNPYGSPNQPDPATSSPYGDPAAYPPAGQYQSQPYGTGGYPAAAAFGAAPARPGMVTAAAVLAFIVGGLDIVVGLLALLAGTVAASVIAGLGGFIIILSILILAIGGLYIWAGLMALQGKNAKILTIVAGVATAIQLIYMIMDFTAGSLVGLAISVGIIALLLQQQSKDWFRAKGAPTF